MAYAALLIMGFRILLVDLTTGEEAWRRTSEPAGMSQIDRSLAVASNGDLLWEESNQGRARSTLWRHAGTVNRYDGNSFRVYKNDPGDPGSLSHNFIRDVFEDAQGYLWVAAYPVINKFDPRTERSTRYRHDPNNPNSFSDDSVESITSDSRGYLWFATADTGLDRFDPATETFTNLSLIHI